MTLCFDVAFWALDYVTPALSGSMPVLVARLLELAVVLALLRWRGLRPARLRGAGLALIVAGALLDTSAFIAFNIGLGTAYTTIVAALASLFSAVTVLPAWAILRERLAPAQWAGVAVILAGVLLVSL